ncbi:hypothetical protein M0R72_15140 [Candidatus Pacearchaeota archaeon]|jgi:hypothetical protein|nr:hypothetical protein [Candidatus Pacearchaeota archaeon]
MSDYKIVNMLNGGARIYESVSGLVDQPPHNVFEISKNQFDELKRVIAGSC